MESAIEVQRLARENADHVQDYLRDLCNWQRDIKLKDEALMKNKNPVSGRHFPPTRAAGNVGVKSQLNKANKKDDKNGKKISAYDYPAWDKFNADEECEKIDAAEERKKESEDDEVMAMRNKQEAVIVKDKGNDFFKKGELDKAIEWYNRGITLDPTNAALFANRAITFLKKGRYAEAEADCDSALALDPTYAKVYQRRATARKALGKLAGAKDDLEEVLRVLPDSGQVRKELDEVVALIQACEDSSDEMCLKPVIKPDHLRSKRAMKDIPIVDVGPKISRPVPVCDPQRTEKSTVSVPNKKENPPEVPAVPKTAFQFQTDWRLLRNHGEIFYTYLKKIPPQNYPRLFGQSLESSMLSDLLRTYANFYVRDGLDVKGPLEALTSTARFLTLVMFMTAQDKKVVRQLIEYLKTASENDEYTDALSKKYEL